MEKTGAFSLAQLLQFDDFVVQCHDNPDADAIASAFAVYSYLSAQGKSAKIIYSGRMPITKANIVKMIEELNIPVEYAEQPLEVTTLIVVDGQYGARNVSKMNAVTVIVIDHHQREKTDFDLGVIHSGIGSCSTLIWDLLRKENFPWEEHPEVSTALYYGLYMDTNSLSEISHPLDKDMRDALHFNPSLIRQLQNMNFTLEEMMIAGNSLTQYKADHDLRYAIFHAEPCDPNILGVISDFALQVDSIDACVVYCIMSGGVKLSVRSCTREVRASDFVAFITRGVGNGGGHIGKAGGFIDADQVSALGFTIDDYLEMKVKEYAGSYDVVKAADHHLDVTAMLKYRKKKMPVGYVRSTDIFPAGTPVVLRTLEGDEEAVVSEEIYFMVGIVGEIYPTKAAKFQTFYVKTDDVLEKTYEYSPTVINQVTGASKDLSAYIQACTALDRAEIYGQRLERDTRVFNSWAPDGYLSGSPGDYIAIRSDDLHDVYVIRGDIFDKTYEPV
jgi:phosphoglycolate phosphatase